MISISKRRTVVYGLQFENEKELKSFNFFSTSSSCVVNINLNAQDLKKAREVRKMLRATGFKSYKSIYILTTCFVVNSLSNNDWQLLQSLLDNDVFLRMWLFHLWIMVFRTNVTDFRLWILHSGVLFMFRRAFAIVLKKLIHNELNDCDKNGWSNLLMSLPFMFLQYDGNNKLNLVYFHHTVKTWTAKTLAS